MLVSPAEREFIALGVKDGIRADGRSNQEFKRYQVETGIIKQASGSCRIRFDGGSDVLVGVKVSVGDFHKEQDDEMESVLDVGKIICSVECSPSAKVIFEKRDIDEMCTRYTQLLDRTFNGPQGGIDLQKLSIIPGGVCWVLHVDVLIFDYGGNLLDTIFMATRGALYNTRLAKVSVESTDGAYDFEVADEETEILVGRDDVPISVTVFNIDNVLVLDASPLEELCASACVSVLVNRQGLICGIQKGLKKPIEPSVLTSMLQTGQSKALENLEQLNEHLFKEEKRQLNDEEPIGFR